MYKLIENEESVYKVIMKEENSIRSEHTGKVLKEYKFESTFKEYVDDSAFSKRLRNFLDKSKEIPFEVANDLETGQYLVKNYNYYQYNIKIIRGRKGHNNKFKER